MITLKEHITNNTVEDNYSQSVSIEHRKKYAQFFTPFFIAELMAKWILGNDKLKTVLEPAFGLGVFSRALLNQKKDIHIKGFDIDKTIFREAKSYFNDHNNVNLHLEDYMYNDWKNKYDGIICNPPYFKFHDYDNKNILKEIETNLQCKLNGFTNLYTLFLLKSIHQLNTNGRCAYIIPSEFLNSDYGKLVKSHLIETKTLRHVIVINFSENVFDDALTTASIILCANDKKTENVQFNYIKSLSDLLKIENLISSYPTISEKPISSYHFSELKPEIKWKAYYQKQNCHQFKNLVPFSTYAKVVRGIATGANDYFTFNVSKAKLHVVDERYLLPCICKSADVRSPIFTKENFDKLKEKGKNIFLLNAIGSTDTNILAYLRKGELEEINKKYLTASRSPWYSLENRPPAPIWVSVFNRSGLKFIRNEANIANLTTFHCIYPKQNDLLSAIGIDLLFAYLLTDTAKQIFEDNCREYGNGLQKFEPNDLNKGMMLDLSLLNEDTKNKIMKLYQAYKTAVSEENQNKHSFIEDINTILKKTFLI